MSSDHPLHILRVTIWLEPLDTDPPDWEWRGKIESYETGEAVYFQHLEGFADGVHRLGIDGGVGGVDFYANDTYKH